MYSLGQRIRELRMKKGLTQIELAQGLCTPSMISQIESDRARPSYKVLFQLAERLDVPLDKLLVDVDLNLEYVSTYKMARAMVAGREYASAIPLLRELLDTPRGQIPTMDIMYELADCYRHIGQLQEALQLFEEVQELATLRQDHHTVAAVLTQIGKIHFRRKQYQLSIYQWQKALEELDRLEGEDRELQGELHGRLGEVFVKMGQVHDALNHFEQSMALFDQLQDLNEIAHVYKGLGQAYRMANHLEKATDYSERAAALYETLDESLLKIRQNVHTAALYVDSGRFAQAEPLLREVIGQFRAGGHREEEGVALVELAKLHWKRGEFDTAEETCRQARSLLPELHLYQGWINRVLGAVALHREQREEAMRRLQTAADCFKTMGEIGAWDETMYETARLHHAAGDLEQAYRIVEEIRRYSREALEQRGIVL